MPFIQDEKQQIEFDRAIGSSDKLIQETTFSERFNAAFRQENTVGSFLAEDNQLPDGKKITDFDTWSYLTEEEKLDENFVSNTTYVDNREELGAVRRQRDKELRDREIIADGSMLEIGLASVIDPINFIPVGSVGYKTYKTGGSILKNAFAVGATSGVAMTMTEAELHRTQLVRTFGESAANVTAATLLGGVLGVAPGAISKLFKKTDLEDIEKTMNPEGAIADGVNSAMADRSIGAAEVMEDVQVRGKVARMVTKFVGFDPLSRTITSDAKATRIASAKLAENPLDMDTTLSTSVESAIKVHDGRYFEAIEGHERFFNAYKASGGTLSRKEFGDAVGKGVRNNSDDINIQGASDIWKSKLYNPLKNMAIEAKLLPEDVGVDTALNYLNRVWSKEKIAAKFPDFVKVVSKWLDEQNQIRLSEGKLTDEIMEEVDVDGLAREIAARIMGTPDGRLPYEYKIGENSAKVKDSGLAGPFKNRSFLIPDKLVEPFLENNIEKLGARYLKGVTPDIELVKMFDDVNMSAELKAIEKEYTALMKANPQKATKLKKQWDRDVENIAAMRDRLRGVYSVPDSSNLWVRASRVARDLNYMRLLGGVVAASIPDVARVVAAEGIAKTFSKGLKPLIVNTKSFKVGAREAKLYGVGTDALMGGRAEIIADVADYAAGGTAFERGVRSAAEKFSSVNLMNYWTGGIKQLHAVTMQTRVIEDMMLGKYDPRMGQLGVDEGTYKGIAEQIKKYGKKLDGVWVANSREWDNQDLAMMWGAAVRKESDRVIIVPGQEKPLFMSNELGKTIFQFKTFMFSATQRVMISTLQAQDKHFMQGIMGLVSIGMLSYMFKQWDAGRPISDDPKVWVAEGIDRSGMIGILMEANNTMEKISGNHYGLRPLIGINAPASRYASRSALDSAIGPTFGLAGDVIKVASGITGEREMTDSDVRAFRRLLPGQNLSFLRQGLDKLEEEVK